MVSELIAVATQRVIAGEPVWGVVWDLPQTPNDSGFTCWSWPDEVEFRERDALFGDAEMTDAEAAALAEQHAAVSVRSLIDEHPGVGRLMDQARTDPDHQATVE
jgi:hypothetical protein